MKKSIVCFVIEKRMVTPITAAAALCFYTKISCFRLDVKINVELEANVEGMVARGEGGGGAPPDQKFCGIVPLNLV